ncbi:cytochrome c oxidase assembly protein [Mycolicibacterium elephantis]|uniref:cytochrome c oxidase assembly protein n=1 Tax=Mycolicibacterium elephantis TaxID=81858 RepID=UPI000FE1B0FB|nr:cytochrome c oxidase assembly protein [Mycolicibacterium elephantis]
MAAKLVSISGSPGLARRLGVLVGGYAATGLALAGYALVSGARPYAAIGDSYPGTATAVGEPVGYFTASLCGALCLGALVYIVTTACPDRGVIDAAAFRIHLVAERLAVVWALAAAAMIVVQAASDAGVAATRLVRSAGLGDAIGASEMSRGWVVTALCAAVLAVSLRVTVRWVAHCVLVVPAAVGVVAVPVTGNAGQGPDHDYATSAVIVFVIALMILAGVKAAVFLVRPDPALSRPVLVVQVCAGAIALAYGAQLLFLLAEPGSPEGPYRWFAMTAGAVLLIVWLSDLGQFIAARRSKMPGVGVLASCGALAMICVVALVGAMAVQTAPRLLAREFTAWDVLLGYALPEPPDVVRLLTVWRFDTLIGVGAAALAALYIVGVLRLRRRGDRWPAGRMIAWLAGCLALIVTSSSGAKAYGSAMFSVHMAEHMTLNMFIPVLLVLGGPVTLALRALPAAAGDQPPGPREWLVWLVHSRVTALLAHPVTAFVLFVASVYVVYFTPLFDTLARYHWGHELMSIHFLVTGYLFFWGIIGIDPGPRRLPFLGRLAMLFAVMPFHAFFGIATMTMTSSIGGNFYRSLDLPWLDSVIDDQHLGGAIAWGSSELPVIIVVIALVVQWARQDRRVASRADRHAESSYADDELDAYNAMLRELSRSRR